MLKLNSVVLVIALALFGCGGSDSGEDVDFVRYSPIDQVLVSEEGQVVSQFVDAVTEGVFYKSYSESGLICEGKTTAKGEFLAYPGGMTEFRIGNVDLGTWSEPGQPDKRGSIVQLRQLSYGQTTCSSLDPTTTAQILLGLNVHPNFFQIKIPDNQTLVGCPQDSDFFSKNNINITPQQAYDHIVDTSDRIEVQKHIASLLFKIPINDIDIGDPKIGANYHYNNYGQNKDWESTIKGYVGGHAGVDFQTKDVAKIDDYNDPTADRSVYSLTY